MQAALHAAEAKRLSERADAFLDVAKIADELAGLEGEIATRQLREQQSGEKP